MNTKKVLALFLSLVLSASLFAGCGSEKTEPSADAQTSQTEEQKPAEEKPAEEKPAEEKSDKVASSSDMVEVESVVTENMVPIHADSLKDGTYPIEVNSSSSMFKITSCELTVAEGKMTAKMVMGGKGYLKVFMGTGEEAASADESQMIPFEELSSGEHCFTVPVEALDAEIKCSAFSKKKEKWYDRSLAFRADSLPLEAFAEGMLTSVESLGLEDGAYTANVSLVGGTGKVTVQSPAKLTVADGKVTATIIWSSDKYDYMMVDGEKYLPVTIEGGSTFEIPVKAFDWNLAVAADTTAMSTPHEIDYVLNFESASLVKE